MSWSSAAIRSVQRLISPTFLTRSADVEAAQTLAAAIARMPALTSVNLTNIIVAQPDAVGIEVLATLANSLRNRPLLQELSFSDNAVVRSPRLAAANQRLLSSLQNPKGIAAIAPALTNRNLRRLFLNNCGLNSGELQQLHL